MRPRWGTTEMMEALLTGITHYQAETAILDVTGVRVLDTQVANELVCIARAAGLLGAQVFLTGISSEIAQTIVTLGADMSTLHTVRNFQTAIALALRGVMSFVVR